jgi:hypothetical protein
MSSIAHRGDTSASTSEEVTNESAKKAQQETSIVDKEQPDGVDRLEATIEINF